VNRPMTNPRGFTLIEIMIVVAVIGILLAVAVPNYTQYVLKSHRAAAITAVLDVASREARYYTVNNTYTNSLTALGYTADPMLVTDSNNHFYDLTITAASSSGFTVKAVPAGKQVKDTCGTYIYNDLGVKSISSGSLADCWKQ
jgi:type IV pilus assembly protein PilE